MKNAIDHDAIDHKEIGMMATAEINDWIICRKIQARRPGGETRRGVIGWETIGQLTLVAVLPNGDVEPLDGWVWDNLSAEENVEGWRVVDYEGGVWWPDAQAQGVIADSDEPSAAAIAMCETAPERGVWCG
jgi:hypothetical protein